MTQNAEPLSQSGHLSEKPQLAPVTLEKGGGRRERGLGHPNSSSYWRPTNPAGDPPGGTVCRHLSPPEGGKNGGEGPPSSDPRRCPVATGTRPSASPALAAEVEGQPGHEAVLVAVPPPPQSSQHGGGRAAPAPSRPSGAPPPLAPRRAPMGPANPRSRRAAVFAYGAAIGWWWASGLWGAESPTGHRRPPLRA